MITIDRTDTEHSGPACYRAHKDGAITVLCPYGHYVEHIAAGQWATSSWSSRASWGDDRVTCHGALANDAQPYPFNDTFLGQGKRL